MYIRYGFDLAYELPQATPFTLLLHTHPSIASKVLDKGEQLVVTPEVPVADFVDTHGNHGSRLVAPAGHLRLSLRGIAKDDGLPDPIHPEAGQHPIQEVPADVLRYLLPSRYCEVDKLGPLAWRNFAAIQEGWERVQAVCDWVHESITFDYQQARADRTAYEALAERVGVCRDFTHLAVTLCRCLNIPARYATGYLGDIGVPRDPNPMDFSAWFEVYLGGRWHTFDARHNARRIGRLVMAYGRDAADAAFTTSYGPHILSHFSVVTEEVTGQEAAAQLGEPLTPDTGATPRGGTPVTAQSVPPAVGS